MKNKIIANGLAESKIKKIYNLKHKMTIRSYIDLNGGGDRQITVWWVDNPGLI